MHFVTHMLKISWKSQGLVEKKEMSMNIYIKSACSCSHNFYFIWTASCAIPIFHPQKDSASKNCYFALREIDFYYKPSMMWWQLVCLNSFAEEFCSFRSFFLDSHKKILSQIHSRLWWKYRTKYILTPLSTFLKSFLSV